MATHTQLPIYKAAYDLLDVATDLVKNMPRDFKQSIGGKINSECVEIVVLIFRANCAQDKAPHLLELVERLQVAELLIRLAKDKRLISQGAYAKAVELSTSIGKQANGWRRALRRRTYNDAIQRTCTIDSADLLDTANSYFGLLRQTTHSHHDRALLANVLLKRGHSIKGDLTKTYRKKGAKAC